MREPECFKGQNFLAIDQGSNLFGLTLVQDGKIRFSKAFETKGVHSYERVDQFCNAVRSTIAMYNVSCLVFEHGTTLGDHKNADARVVLCVLEFNLKRIAHETGSSLYGISLASIKREIGNKERMQREKDAGERENLVVKKRDLRLDIGPLFGLDLSGEEYIQDQIDSLCLAYVFCKCPNERKLIIRAK